MATRITDRFDQIPEDLVRVGAHRAPAQRGRGWIGVAWAALATVALVAAGLFGLSLLNPDLEIRVPGLGGASVGPSDTPVATDPVDAAEPSLNPALPITVLNGTPTAGNATSAGDQLVSKGWEGAEVGIGTRAKAASSDVATTEIFYSDPANEGAARQLALDLGVGTLRLSNDYPASPLTVLLGADYAPAA